MGSVTFVTAKGTFRVELYADDAPGTVANFRKLVSERFYDGIVFHRVIPEFVVQGGDPLTKELPLTNPRVGSGGPGYTIACETNGNRHRHEEGALSMAHAGRDTGGSQFFIVLNERNARHLDGVHTVFGRVVEGMDVVKAIRAGDTIEQVSLDEAQPGSSGDA
jgi:peptidyl-prolyl cis-trans isomerase B (cyclophilin B)